MPAQSYAKTGAISPETSLNPSLLPDNRINLHPEQLIVIERTFLIQFAKTTFTTYESRILMAIYNQTLGYDKFEDDLNGVRLQQLTGIRNDHANTAVRSLQQKNVILIHQANHGYWMSINFDLSHWGEAYLGVNNNDPRLLLLLEENKNPIDAGLDLSAPIKQPDEKQTPELGDTDNRITITNNNQQQHKQTVVDVEKVIDANNVVKDGVITKEIQKETKETIKEKNEVVKKIIIKKDVKKPTKLIKPTTLFEYPVSLSKKVQQQLAPLLTTISDPKEAQALLNYFAQCLLNTTIRKPIAYFQTLLKRFKKGVLHLSDSDTESPVKKAKQDQAKRELRDHKIAHNEALIDYEQMKKRFEKGAKEEQCDFEAYVNKLAYKGIWQGVIAKLKGFQEVIPVSTQ